MAKKHIKNNTLPAHLVLYLHHKIFQQFEQEYLQKHNSVYEYVHEAMKYGAGSSYNDPAIDSIWSYMCSNLNVVAAVQQYQKSTGGKVLPIHKAIESSYLWKKVREAEAKPNEAIGFKDHYKAFFLAYLGKNIATLEEEYENSYTYFVGLYMTFSEFAIKTLLFKISSTPDKEGRYELMIEGIHAKENADKEAVYEGKVWRENGWLYGFAQAHTKELSNSINLLGSIKKQEPIASNAYFRVLLQGVTYSGDRAFGWEVVLHKTTADEISKHRNPLLYPKGPVHFDILEQGVFKNIALYLVLHRNVISFKTEEIRDIGQLEAKGVKVGKIAYIRGGYRLWNFDFEHGYIIQSKFHINNDGTGYLETRIPPKQRATANTVKVEKGVEKEWRQDIIPGLQRQSALVNVSKAHDSSSVYKIVAITFNKLDIVNVAMFDFPAHGISIDDIIEGSFALLSDPLNGNISGYFVMKKEDNLDDVVVQHIKLDQALEFARSQNLIPFLHALLKINKEKHLDPILSQADMINEIFLKTKFKNDGKQITEEDNRDYE